MFGGLVTITAANTVIRFYVIEASACLFEQIGPNMVVAAN